MRISSSSGFKSRHKVSGAARWKTPTHEATFFADQPVHNLGFCGYLLSLLSFAFIVVTAPISLFFCIKIVQEYERAVVFRLGRLISGGGTRAIRSNYVFMVAVDVVVYFRVSNATISITNVEDSSRSTKLLAQTTLRNVLGTKTLTEMLSDREQISLQIQETLDEATDPWGVKVERVEIKDIRLPYQLQRAMAAEAEATREARAKIIAAEGEQIASKVLSKAAATLAQSPSAIHLSLLQTLKAISAEKNQTIVLPIPAELIRWLNKR